jgi:hypothetical protein
MSTGKTIVSYAVEALNLEELRRQQEAAAERERVRLGVAHAEIQQLDRRFRALVHQLDQASHRLPDLTLQAPEWVNLDDQRQGVADVERHAGLARTLVSRFEQQLSAAVREAEAVLARRIALAAAWRHAHALHEALPLHHQQLVTLCQQLGEEPPVLPSLARPSAEATLAEVEAHIQALQQAVRGAEQTKSSARRRLASKQQARHLAGQAVGQGLQAQEALETHITQQRQRVRSALQTTLDQALRSAQLDPSALPEGTQALLDAVLDADEDSALHRERIQRVVAREKVLETHAAQARALMLASPNLVHAQPGRSRRWLSLVQSLQNVSAGLEAFSPFHQQEYEQIALDAQRDLDRIYVQSSFAQSLREQDLLARETEDGRLVIEDLRRIGVRMEEAQALELSKGQRGGMATLLELKTDQDLPPDQEPAVVDDVCQRLQAAARSTPQVQTTCVELEHQRRIPRSKRPTGLKRLHANL